MKRIYEAIRFDGTRALVSPTVIDSYLRTAKLHYGHGNRAVRMASRFLASFMYVHDFKTLVEIRYDVDGNQSRTTVITKR